jgi:hypothetical protein
MGVAKLVEGHHEVRLAQEAPQWHGDDWVKLGFCALDIVKIYGYGGSIYRVFRFLTCATRSRTCTYLKSLLKLLLVVIWRRVCEEHEMGKNLLRLHRGEERDRALGRCWAAHGGQRPCDARPQQGEASGVGRHRGEVSASNQNKHSKAFLFFKKPFIFSNSFESIQNGFEFERILLDSKT